MPLLLIRTAGMSMTKGSAAGNILDSGLSFPAGRSVGLYMADICFPAYIC